MARLAIPSPPCTRASALPPGTLVPRQDERGPTGRGRCGSPAGSANSSGAGRSTTSPRSRTRIGDAYAQNRLRTWLLALFAATALGLVCAGVYGTLSYAVSLRRREVALRLALGAPRRNVVSATDCHEHSHRRRGLGVWPRARAHLHASLATLLYGVTPADPATLIGVVALVVTVACVAAVVPATRAAFMSPMRALRED